MLAILFTALIVESAEKRLTPREEKFISGIDCLRAELKKDCLSVKDDDGDFRCEWKDYACSALSRETSLTDVFGPASFDSLEDTSSFDSDGTELYDGRWKMSTGKFGFSREMGSANIDAVSGCCRGYSLKSQLECQSFEDELSCETEYCEWLLTDDASDCIPPPMITPTPTEDDESADNETLIITTTEETTSCCRGIATLHDDECDAHSFPVDCFKYENCLWLVSAEPNLCPPLLITTTSNSLLNDTTTTAADEEYDDEEGCCKGDAPETNEKCNAHIESTMCAADEKCEWMVGNDTDLCEFPIAPTTTSTSIATSMTAPINLTTTESAPTVIGCCTLNEGNSDRWMDSCTTVFTEDECAAVSNLRCHWEAKEDGDVSDCVTTTTTSTAAPGCCFGSTMKTQSKCAEFEDEALCERKRCEWLETDDVSDCVLTTTASPTTTEEIGCCGGVSESKNAKCNLKDGRKSCERSGNCDWNSGADADCAWSTEEPEDGCCASTSEHMAERCARMSDEQSCDAIRACEWEAQLTDCSWPWTTEKTTTTGSAQWTTESVEWTTEMETTDAPWMGAHHRHGHGLKDESMLFGETEGSVGYRSMNYAVSLSSVLIFTFAVLVAYSVYRWLSGRKEYSKISEPQETNSRALRTIYESA